MNDVFRPKYRQLTADEQNLMLTIKQDAKLMHDTLDRCTPSRETSLAKTKLEEAVMRAVKGITG